MDESTSLACRVLLVEDDPCDARLVCQALHASGEPRFDTVWVTTLAEARRQLFENPPDVLLLDLSLPDSSGLDTVRLGVHAAGGLPLIVLTGRDDSGFALQTLEVGAQDYLVKGRFDTDDLVRAIRYAISRGRLEQRLAETGMHLLTLINAMPDIICFKDGEGRWLEANDFALELFQLEGVDYRGKKDSELAAHQDFYRETFLACEASDEAAWRAGGASQEEEIIPRPDTSPLVFEIVRVPLFHEDGRRKGLVVVGRDITKRKQAEVELEFRHVLLVTLQETTLDGVLVVDEAGNILFYNRRFVEMWGIPAETIAARSDAPVLKLVVDQVAEPRRFLEKVRYLYAHQREIGQDELALKDGRIVERYSAPVFGYRDQYYARVWYFRDMTEKKLAEERLKASNLELQRLATHLEVVREEEQKRIARELHDEMGGVLAALNINVSLLAADIPAAMPQLLTDVGSLEKLVADGIKTMRQTVAALRPSLLDEVGLKLSIEKYVQEFKQNTGVECELRLPEEDLVLDANQAAAIFRIAQEALTNVVRHAAADKVNITLSEWDGTLMLTVKDNGRGFDPATSKARSFGLLGIRERAAMAGGKAEIISQVGKGTTIRVSMAARAGMKHRRQDFEF